MPEFNLVAFTIAGFIALLFVGFAGLDEIVVSLSKKLLGRSAFFDRVLRLFSWTPFPILVLFIVPTIYYLVTGEFQNVITLTAVCSLSLGLAFLGKYLFRRGRPLGHLTYIGKVDSAFPSAHTAGSFAAAFVLASFVSDLAVLVLIFASLVALSRVYLQLHFVSDVAGGLLLAYIFTLFVFHSNFLDFLQYI